MKRKRLSRVLMDAFLVSALVAGCSSPVEQPIAEEPVAQEAATAEVARPEETAPPTAGQDETATPAAAPPIVGADVSLAIAEQDIPNFVQLLADLLAAYETPSENAWPQVEGDLGAIESTSAPDAQIARSIADEWRQTYVEGAYELVLWEGADTAYELEDAGIPDDSSHAFVVLGYELKDGEMTDELRLRCEAAAAAARAYPNTLIVCSGGPTGQNNPDKHTEAGLMRDYLVQACGIEEGRILTDERAMTTAENALNTMEMLAQAQVRTMTLVTSSYHQRWAQMVYNALVARTRAATGYEVVRLSNYCLDIEPSNPRYYQDARIAVKQIGQVLGIDKMTLAQLPQA